MGFPHESEPDGDRYLGHHFWIGLGLMVLGWAQWSPRGTPVIGAALVGVGFLVALDDYISHAFGVWTPLDALFKWAIRRVKN